MPFKPRDRVDQPHEYHPRWIAYARAHGKAPAAAHADDRAKHAAHGHMHLSFEAWIRAQWDAFDADRGIKTGPGTELVRDAALQQALTDWLVARYPEPKRP